ncbi:MAG: three-Cys-motif partner protein TcmP [Kangiellaceae bacterium]|nr:three-Cys-motif partner protein TcmP [Kangiellaceae bacterium]
MAKKDNFRWKIGEPLPSIEAHTERKLEVIEQYLDIYFDTVTASRRMDNLRITIVDGFCGGGLYQKGHETRFGSPFVLLNAVERAKVRVNEERHKPLEISAQFYFSDANSIHMAALRDELQRSEYASRLDNTIILQTGKFDELLPSILTDIRKRQRQGRSFFVLDQWGYTDVPIQSLQKIFSNLQKPEAILTFSIDALLNYLRKDGTGLDGLKQFGVNPAFVSMWQELKDDENFGRATAQRSIMEAIRHNSGAQFFTPFMMYSKTDKRWMLLAHLSKHQAARDKMLSVHWDQQNHFQHIGKGSLFEMGFDHRLFESKDSLFSFRQDDERKLLKELEDELPARVMDSMVDNVLAVDQLLSQIGNLTAAKNNMIFDVLQKLVGEGELQIIKKDGGRKKASTLIEVSDKLVRPEQPLLFSKYFPK